MTIKRLSILLLTSLTLACKKDRPVENITKESPSVNLSLAAAKTWVYSQTRAAKDTMNWSHASFLSTDKGTTLQVMLPGKPEMDGIKGYQKLIVHKDRQSGQIQGKLLDYLYDAHNLQTAKQTNRQANPEAFTGSLFIHDLNGKLEGGYLLSEGKKIGLISPDTSLAKRRKAIPAQSNSRSSSTDKKISAIHIIEHQYWIESSYVDAYGVFTVHAQCITVYTFYDDGMGSLPYPGIPGYENGNEWEYYSGGGGSYSPPPPPAPEMSNLPGEEGAKTDPKKMTKCFDDIPDQGATVNIKVYIQEPFPGHTYNVGPNSVGHVAIGITKTNGNQSVTQVMGFYPDASGAGRYSAPSKILDNGGDLEYNVSASYTIGTDQLKNILAAINNPPAKYHAMEYNCTNFVFDALKSGGVNLPDPTVTVGLPTPGGYSNAMTPAGLSQAYRIMLYNNPNSKITIDTSTTPNSKGPCND